MNHDERNEIKLQLGMQVAEDVGEIDWDTWVQHNNRLRPLCARLRKVFGGGSDPVDDNEIINEALTDLRFRNCVEKAKRILDEENIWWKAFINLKFLYLVKGRQDVGLAPDIPGWTSYEEGGVLDYSYVPRVTGFIPEQTEPTPLRTPEGDICLKVPNDTQEVPAAPNTAKHISFGNCSPDSSIFILQWQLLRQQFENYKRLTFCSWSQPFFDSMMAKLEVCFLYISEDMEAERVAFLHHLKTDTHDHMWGNLRDNYVWPQVMAIITQHLRMMVCKLCGRASLAQKSPNLRSTDFFNLLIRSEKEKRKRCLITKKCKFCKKRAAHYLRFQLAYEGLAVELDGAHKKKSKKLSKIFELWKETVAFGDGYFNLTLDITLGTEYYKKGSHALAFRKEDGRYYRQCDGEPEVRETELEADVPLKDPTDIDCVFYVRS